MSITDEAPARAFRLFLPATSRLSSSLPYEDPTTRDAFKGGTLEARAPSSSMSLAPMEHLAELVAEAMESCVFAARVVTGDAADAQMRVMYVSS